MHLEYYPVIKIKQVNSPVCLQSEDQDLIISPGDYLIGDLNGVVCLPKELAETALNLVPSQVEADERIAEDIKAGVSFAQSSKKHRASVGKP